MVGVDHFGVERDRYIRYPKTRAVGWGGGRTVGGKALVRERKKGRENSIIST